jgi:hypothetical protein
MKNLTFTFLVGIWFLVSCSNSEGESKKSKIEEKEQTFYIGETDKIIDFFLPEKLKGRGFKRGDFVNFDLEFPNKKYKALIENSDIILESLDSTIKVTRKSNSNYTIKIGHNFVGPIFCISVQIAPQKNYSFSTYFHEKKVNFPDELELFQRNFPVMD